ncbi:MAG: S-methyl-5-thioribose-1-phosphate isomerase [Planctomycetaceae bacterium]|nr:S-methyl-5-thioribose-1-phosphate isomerase [Planctomycetaceae bacterium]MCP4462342.1 S-methyl-5-thioribose-1-phosphate isomerase [Planctomycetaceae bacterium]
MSSSIPSQTETLAWQGDTEGHLVLIDQTKLPTELVTIDCQDLETVWEAIKMLRVRGAPAIGIAAAYGVVIGIRDAGNQREALIQKLNEVTDYLATSRPTAVNLFWALSRMKELAHGLGDESASAIRSRLLQEARAIHEEDRQMCHAIGRHGAALLDDKVSGVLTHCNAGGLATAEYGTALSVFFTAHDLGKQVHVYVDETRPLLQGARLTAWELMQRNIPATLICDSMAAQVMRENRVQAVVTGADRIAANGDAANKIGTYSLAILANYHQVPFYIAAPSSTFDLSISSGDEIPIEKRLSEEITEGFGKRTAPEGVDVYNPAFDVTPAKLITAIITERGVIDPISTQAVAEHLRD